MNPLDGPIPFPSARSRVDELENRLTRIRTQVASRQLLARLSQYPEWPEMCKLAAKMMAEMEETLLSAEKPPEIFRLQGGIKVLSEFLEAPEKASEQISKLTREMEVLEDELEKLTRP